MLPLNGAPQSPQLINSKTNDTGYDAQKADVWACGVLLFVMMLGMFPFEHSDHPDPNSSEAHAEVRCTAGQFGRLGCTASTGCACMHTLALRSFGW